MSPTNSQLLGFAVEIATAQLRNGRHFVCIPPTNSPSSHARSLKALRSIREVHTAIADGCTLGSRCIVSEHLVAAGWQFVTTMPQLDMRMQRRCAAGPVHVQRIPCQQVHAVVCQRRSFRFKSFPWAQHRDDLRHILIILIHRSSTAAVKCKSGRCLVRKGKAPSVMSSKKVAGELVKVHQLRSQLGPHQSPSMSLFACRRSQLFRQGGSPNISSHRTDAHSRAPPMMCSFPRDTTSLHRPPHCNHVTWKESWYHSWSGVLSWHSACWSAASILFSRSSELSPLVQRLCRVETNCSRSDPDLRSGGLLGSLDCETPETDNWTVLGLLQRVKAFCPLVLRLGLNGS